VICDLQTVFTSVVGDLSSVMLGTEIFLGKIFFVVLKVRKDTFKNETKLKFLPCKCLYVGFVKIHYKTLSEEVLEQQEKGSASLGIWNYFLVEFVIPPPKRRLFSQHSSSWDTG